MKKRAIAWFTAIVMLLTSVPGNTLSAFAEEVPEAIAAESYEEQPVFDSAEDGFDEEVSPDSEIEFTEDAVSDEILNQDAMEEESGDFLIEEDISGEVQEEELLFADGDDEVISTDSSEITDVTLELVLDPEEQYIYGSDSFCGDAYEMFQAVAETADGESYTLFESYGDGTSCSITVDDNYVTAYKDNRYDTNIALIARDQATNEIIPYFQWSYMADDKDVIIQPVLLDEENNIVRYYDDTLSVSFPSVEDYADEITEDSPQTLGDSDTEWFCFTPEESAEYYISVTSEDAFYVTGGLLGFQGSEEDRHYFGHAAGLLFSESDTAFTRFSFTEGEKNYFYLKMERSEGEVTVRIKKASPMTAIELNESEVSLFNLQIFKELYIYDFLSGTTFYEDNTSYPIQVGASGYNFDDEGNLSSIGGMDGANTSVGFSFFTPDGEWTALRYDQPGEYKVRASYGYGDSMIFDDAILIVTDDMPDIIELTEDEEENIHIDKCSPVYIALDGSMSEEVTLTVTGSGMDELRGSLLRLVDGAYEYERNVDISSNGEDSANCHCYLEEGETYLLCISFPRYTVTDDEFNGTVALGSEEDDEYATVTWHKNFNGSEDTCKEKRYRDSSIWSVESRWNDDDDVSGLLPDGFYIGNPDGELFTDFDEGYELTEDIDLYLHWVDAVSVNWDLQGGTWMGQYGQVYTGTVTEKHLPHDCIDSSYFNNDPNWSDETKRFVGWSLTPGGALCEEDRFEDILDGNNSITLFAVYRKEITVTLNGGDGAKQIVDWDDDDIPVYEVDPIYTMTTTAGGYVELDGRIFYKDGYVITGWTMDGDPGQTYDVDEYVTFEESVTLNAVWSKAYNVKFYPDGGTIGSEDGDGVMAWGDNPLVFRLAPGQTIDTYYAKKEGYVFDGWEDENGEFVVEPGEEFTLTVERDISFYPSWKDSCTITLKTNGGYWYWDDDEPYTEDQVCYFGEGEEIYYDDLDIPEHDTKLFAGWATTENPTEDDIVLYSYSGNGITLTRDITFYAVWTDGITIHWDPQGGHWEYDEDEGEMPDSSVRTGMYRSGYSISSNEIDDIYWQDETKVFTGWSLTPGGEIWLPEDSSMEVTEDLDGQTLYAVYDTPIIITLNGGEGSFSKSGWHDGPVYEGPSVIERTVATGSVFWLDPDLFYKEGYTLTGWELDGDPTQKYSNYRDYTFDSSVTLNAVWKEAASITWDPNGGSWIAGTPTSVISPRTDQVGLGETVWSPEALKEGHALLGWSTEREGGDIFVKAGRSFIVSQKQMTLYAQWMKGYQVTFVGNGGHTDSTVYPETTVVKMVPEGETVDSYSVFICEGKAFVGWAADDPNGEPVDIFNYTINKDTVFYAIWEDGYQVTYELCGGRRSYDGALRFTKMLPKNSVLYPDAESYNLTHPDGKAFVGWSTVENDKTHLLPGYSEEMMKLTGPITLYAIWENGCLVTYDANGGYFNNNPGTTIYSKTVPEGSFFSNSLVIENPDSSLMFLGYSTSKDRKDLVFNAFLWNQDYQITQPVTLYAIWVPFHKVIYDGNGKDLFSREPYDRYEFRWPDGEGYYGYQDMIIPEDLQPLFKGWSTTPDGRNRFDFTDKTVTSDMTFYAIWNVSYLVSYEFISSSGEELPREVLALCPVNENEYEDGETVTLAGPEKNRKVETDEGYWTFDGYDRNDGFVIDGEDVTITGTWTYTKETPSIEYEFVSADDAELPQAVLDLCPDPAEADKGSTVTPPRPVPESVEDGDYVWIFLEYSPASAKIGSAGVTFTGTWKRTEKDQEVFYIDYEFEASAEDIAEAGELPADVMILRPTKTAVFKGDKPECAAVAKKFVPVSTDTLEGNWVFEGFDTSALPDEMTADVTLTGTWRFESKAAAADHAADVISGIAGGAGAGGNADDLIDILEKADSADILEQLTQNIIAEAGDDPDTLNDKLAEAAAKLDEQLTDETNDPSKKITVSNGSQNAGAFVGTSEPAEDAGTGIRVDVAGAAPTVAAVIRNQDTATLMENDSKNYHYQAEVSVTKVKEQGTELTLDISLNVKIAETNEVVRENVEPTTPVTITMTLPENFIGQDLKLLHTINEATGETEEIQYSSVNDGKQILFTLSSLSPFEVQIINCKHKHPLTHVEGKNATCTADGYKEYYECDICKAKFSDEGGTSGIVGLERIPAAGHQLSHVNRKEATCKEAGHIEYWECGNCKKKFRDSSGMTELNDQDILIPKTSVHKWDNGRVTKAATEDTTGIMTHTCTECKATKTSTIPKVPVKITIKKKPAKFKAKAAKKGKITLTWQKLAKKGKTKALFKQVSKIEIQYSTDSSFAAGVIKKTLAKKKAKLALKLKPKTTYYIRIRYTDGKGGYSAWVTKKVKTKK